MPVVIARQEVRAAEAAAARANQHDELDVEDLLDDPELERLHRDRLLELQCEAEKRATMQHKGHGEYVVCRCAGRLPRICSS
jgi:hypothetical protein